MITIKTKIPCDIDKELRFIESMNNKRDPFLELHNPNEKRKELKKAQWDPTTGQIIGIIDE